MPKMCNRERIFSSIIDAEKAGQPHRKEYIGLLFYTIHKNQLNVDLT